MIKEKSIIQIDIEGLFREKNPTLLRFLPKFILNYLKKIIHQDEINSFLMRHADDDAAMFAKSVIQELEVSVSMEGLENIPETGGAIIALNHPLGGLDAMALLAQLSVKRQDFRIIVNDLLLHLTPLKSIFAGVNKHGRNASKSLQAVDELFSGDNLICIFPAGLVSRRIKGEIQDLEWKKTFVTRAKKYNKPIIPAYIDGELSSFFYTLSNLRKNLGIKSNIEMMFLSHEMFKQKGCKIHFKIGSPIQASTFTSEKSDIEWTHYIRQQVYALQ